MQLFISYYERRTFTGSRDVDTFPGHIVLNVAATPQSEDDVENLAEAVKQDIGEAEGVEITILNFINLSA